MDKVNIKELKNWDKNPRGIREEDFERLKKEVQRLGQYKPLIVNSGKHWGERGTVAGGNMRLRALRDLGAGDILVAWIDPKSEAEMLEYALSDNDRAGFTDEQKLAELLFENKDFPFKDYKVDLGYQADLGELMNRYGNVEGREVGDEKKDLETGDLDNYLNATIKQIILYYSTKEFEKMVGRLEVIIKEIGLTNNSEAVEFLLKYYENDRAKKT